MKQTRPTIGKILEHADGLGAPSEETVRRRARELALIEGRDKPNEMDFRTAYLELHGGFHDESLNGDGDGEMSAAISGRDMVAVSLGHQAERIELENEVNLGEELVAEGLDEAAHDLMLEARREIDLPESEE